MAKPEPAAGLTRAERADALAQLHGHLQACRWCVEAGHDVFPRAVFSGGSQARIMLIGQAPGITEKDAGRPFNAGSGTRLFTWLRQAGLDETEFRRDQYMTAVTKCYPGRAAGGSGDRVPGRAEQALCRPYLEAEIAIVDPELMIPVGRLAIATVLETTAPLEAIIGREFRQGGRWILPLPHPSGASRWHQSQQNRRLVQAALARLRGRVIALGPPSRTCLP
jgi:uracil-DNA glycosylase